MQCERSEPNSPLTEEWRASARRIGFVKNIVNFIDPILAFARRDKGKNARGDGNSDWDRGKSTKKECKK